MPSASKSEKQASISSFFAPSPTRASSSGKKRLIPDTVDLTSPDSDAEGSQSTSSRAKQTVPNPPKRRKLVATTTSPHFKQRNRGEDSEASQNEGPLTASSGSSPSKYLDRFRLVTPNSPTSQAQSEPESFDAKQAKMRRREAFKKTLLSDNNVFHKSSLSRTTSGRTADHLSDEETLSNSDGEDEAVHLPSALASKAFPGDRSKGKGKSSSRAKTSKARSDVEEVGPSGQAYTPLECQVKLLKKKYPDAILMIEVGYKYKFFGDDARIAANLLGIVAFTDRNFLTASIPTHRRDVHLKNLLSQGHKVGIIGQTETAALKKVSDNRGGPFERHLIHLYTAATYIDEVNTVDDPSTNAPGTAPNIMCITETLLGGMGADERVRVGMVIVTPSTGDVIWDEFEDSFIRNELETRLTHIRPWDLLLPVQKLSKVTEKLLSQYVNVSEAGGGRRTRVERVTLGRDTDSFSHVSQFYERHCAASSGNSHSGRLLAAALELPPQVTTALSQIIKYLSSFGLADVLTRTEFFYRFTERQHMLLNANTLKNLEVYQNSTDFTSKGSLMWILDQTKTKFGSRLLRFWIGRPLLNKEKLQERVNAVEEILTCESTQTREILIKLRDLLKGLPDLAKGLCRIQYQKCTPKELSEFLKAFRKIADAFQPVQSPADVGFTSVILNEIIVALPKLRDIVRGLLGDINLAKAAENDMMELWTDPEKYPDIEETQMSIAATESELQDHLRDIRKILHKPAAKYSSIAGEEYLVEIKKDERREIPVQWHLVSSTKFVRRYHTPEVKLKLQERAQCQETLEMAANQAFLSFLTDISEQHYGPLREAINKLAIADCLLSLAAAASQDNYTKPAFVADDRLEIVDGRHPMIENLRSDPFVPNDVALGGDAGSVKIITGPNMGGKSSSVRMIALVVLMAQIGSFVPAASVALGLHDAILTRMGAFDELPRGRSTFMVEMSETSDILRTATKRSLVILDELGRGSSTFDGMAIASATLQHIVQNLGCKTLFITHYPLVAADLERRFPMQIKNVHMGFTEHTGIDNVTSVVFLYKLTAGIASGSFGIECARLASVPESILERAATQAQAMEIDVGLKHTVRCTRRCMLALSRLMNKIEQVNRRDIEDLRSKMTELLLKT